MATHAKLQRLIDAGELESIVSLSRESAWRAETDVEAGADAVAVLASDAGDVAVRRSLVVALVKQGKVRCSAKGALIAPSSRSAQFDEASAAAGDAPELAFERSYALYRGAKVGRPRAAALLPVAHRRAHFHLPRDPAVRRGAQVPGRDSGAQAERGAAPGGPDRA